jgi:hypothetical protein
MKQDAEEIKVLLAENYHIALLYKIQPTLLHRSVQYIFKNILTVAGGRNLLFSISGGIFKHSTAKWCSSAFRLFSNNLSIKAHLASTATKQQAQSSSNIQAIFTQNSLLLSVHQYRIRTVTPHYKAGQVHRTAKRWSSFEFNTANPRITRLIHSEKSSRNMLPGLECSIPKLVTANGNNTHANYQLLFMHRLLKMGK